MRRLSAATFALALVAFATSAAAQPAPSGSAPPPPPPPPPPAGSSAAPPATGAPPIPSAPPSATPPGTPPNTVPGTEPPVTTPPPPNAYPPPGTPNPNPGYPPPNPNYPNPNYPQPGYPQPGYNPGYPPPGPQPPPGPYGPGYGPYGQPGPGMGPPPPPAPEEPSCCRVAFRFDPFDLIFRRLSFQGEVVIWGPLSVELEPTWIWGSERELVDASGFALQGNFAVYFSGRALQGFFLKASAGFETFEAVVTHPAVPDSSVARQVSSPIFGGILGSSTVFGRDGGFNISGGIGIGVATAGEVTITVPGGPFPAATASFYGKASAIQLLGSLGLGGAF